MRGFLKTVAIAATLAATSLASSSPAVAGPGDLLVSPVRVVFEGRQRVTEVTLVNKSDTTATYRLSVENRRMKADGSFEVIETAGDGELFAGDFIRYAPRRVTLEPNAPQTIRLMARKPADLADGEYRSHLQFAAVPDDAGSNSIENQGTDQTNIAIRLTPVYGVTIPVIIRHGDLTANANIKNAKFSRPSAGTGRVSFTFERIGTKSLYGDFSVHLPGEKAAITERRGVALYTPNTERAIDIELDSEMMAKVKGRDVQIRFQDRTKSGADITTSTTLALR